MINLTDLKRLIDMMTPRPWLPHGGDTCYSDIGIDGDADHPDGPVLIASLEGESMNADRPGIIALVNAAPVLLEIVEAVIDCIDKRRLATDVRTGPFTDDYGYQCKASSKALSDANDRLTAALAKVRR
jgi:hypothetical protein